MLEKCIFPRNRLPQTQHTSGTVSQPRVSSRRQKSILNWNLIHFAGTARQMKITQPSKQHTTAGAKLWRDKFAAVDIKRWRTGRTYSILYRRAGTYFNRNIIFLHTANCLLVLSLLLRPLWAVIKWSFRVPHMNSITLFRVVLLKFIHCWLIIGSFPHNFCVSLSRFC